MHSKRSLPPVRSLGIGGWSPIRTRIGGLKPGKEEQPPRAVTAHPCQLNVVLNFWWHGTLLLTYDPAQVYQVTSPFINVSSSLLDGSWKGVKTGLNW